MENNTNLLTDELKKFGIMTENNSFSQKLSDNEIQNFLKGGILIAENEENRLTFSIKDDQLNVNAYTKDIINHKDLSSAELFEISSKNTNLYKVMADYGTITHIGKGHFNHNPENEKTSFLEIENERGKTMFFGNKLDEVLKDSKVGDKIQINQTGIEKSTFTTEVDGEAKDITKYDNLFLIRPFEGKNKQFQSKIFELDLKDKTIKDLDTTKYELQTVNGKTLSEKQLQQLRKGKEVKLDDETDNRKQLESWKYLDELQKLKGFLQSKAEQYPDNKKIISDLNVVSKEISNIQSKNPEYQKQEKNDDTVRLNVNDRDTYEDANRKKEEEIIEEEKSQSSAFKRGR